MKLLSFVLAAGLLADSVPVLPAAEKPPATLPVSGPDLATLLRKPLTLPIAVQIALRNNRMLLATMEDVGLSQADLIESSLLANPQIDFDLKFPDRAPRGTMSEWTIAQNFLDFLLIPLRKSVARQELEGTRARVADAVVETVSEVKIAFIQLEADSLIAAKLATIRDAERSSLEFSQKLHAAGNITDLALLRAQVSYGDTQLAIAQANAENRVHREAFNRLLSLWGDQTDWRITATLPEVPASVPNVKNLESIAVAKRMDLAASRSELSVALQQAGLEKKFRFFGGLSFGLAGERDPDGTNLNGPSISFEFPVFNQQQGKIARAEGRLRQSERRFEGLAIDIRSNVRELRDQLISQADMISFERDQALPNRQKILHELMLNYNAMLTGAFELFTARREVVEVQQKIIETSRDYWITHAKLERTLGGEIPSKNSPAKP